jgi:HD-GYP domain-containing protein (c-di-GMP phosphodiesterase class II)
MDYLKQVTEYNLKNLKKYKNLMLGISIFMSIISFLINDNFEIKFLHILLVIMLLINNILLNNEKYQKKIMKLYVYSFTFWGILRIAFYSERTLTHTPLIGIIMSLAFIHLFPKKRRIFYYFLTFILISFTLVISIEEPLHHMGTYGMFLFLSFMINKNLYNALIDEIKYKKEIKIYEGKLNYKVKNLQEDFNELYEAYPKILDFLSHSNLSKFHQEKEFLISTFRLFSNLIVEADYGSLYIIEDKQVRFIDAIGHDLQLLTSITFDHKIFQIGEKDFQIIKNFEETFADEPISKEENYILKKATRPIKESLMFHVPLSTNKEICIAMDIEKESPLEFSNVSLVKIKAFQNIIRSYYQNNELRELKESLTTDIAMSLTNLLKIHDEYTTDHSEQVAAMALSIGEMMALEDTELQDLYYASLLHDIGKVIIPNTILNKKDQLTLDEFKRIKMHPLIGFEATKDLKNLSSISKYIRHHHERYDGFGYPDQLRGEAIPLISRIITVVDAYDAMTSKRAYRDSLSRDEAVQELIENKGTQFSPEVVDIFLEIRGVSKIV